LRQLFDQSFGVGHLWHKLRMHETRDLKATNPGIDRFLDEDNLAIGWQDLGFALQPVTRPYFDNRNLAHKLFR
jgi:hypothetical protein